MQINEEILSKCVSFLLTSSEIANTKGNIEMEDSDWFYLPFGVWDREEFWDIIASCSNRFDYGACPGFDSLLVDIPQERKAGSIWPKLQPIRKRFKLFALYQIARITKNYSQAKKLTEKYPNWKEAQGLCTELAKKAKT